MRSNKRVVHKTCASWASTQCWLDIFDRNLQTTDRWDEVTCQRCLRHWAKRPPRSARQPRSRSEATDNAAFERWWKNTQGSCMTHSKYLARKAWLAACSLYGKTRRET